MILQVIYRILGTTIHIKRLLAVTSKHSVQFKDELIELKIEPDSIAKLMSDFDKPRVIANYIEAVTAEPPPPIIYHYCNADSLVGILSSGNLWFSDVFTLNDTSEIKHGVNLACELLEHSVARPDTTAPIEIFANAVINELQKNIESSAYYFVCCFSTEEDMLSQWRLYADDARGFALGFDTAELERAFMDEGPNNHATYPMSYKTELMREMQAQLVSKRPVLALFSSV